MAAKDSASHNDNINAASLSSLRHPLDVNQAYLYRVEVSLEA